MILIISALKTEIEPLFQKYDIQSKVVIATGTLYQTESLHLLRTGVGWRAAETVSGQYLTRFHPHAVLNIGLAGSLNSANASGGIFIIERIKCPRQKEEFRPAQLQLINSYPGASLLTVRTAVTDAVRRNRLYDKYHADLVDMEAFYLLLQTAVKNIPFFSIKIVSDQADEQAEEDARKNYKALCQKLTDFVIKEALPNLI